MTTTSDPTRTTIPSKEDDLIKQFNKMEEDMEWIRNAFCQLLRMDRSSLQELFDDWLKMKSTTQDMESALEHQERIHELQHSQPVVYVEQKPMENPENPLSNSVEHLVGSVPSEPSSDSCTLKAPIAGQGTQIMHCAEPRQTKNHGNSLGNFAEHVAGLKCDEAYCESLTYETPRADRNPSCKKTHGKQSFHKVRKKIRATSIKSFNSLQRSIWEKGKRHRDGIFLIGFKELLHCCSHGDVLIEKRTRIISNGSSYWTRSAKAGEHGRLSVDSDECRHMAQSYFGGDRRESVCEIQGTKSRAETEKKFLSYGVFTEGTRVVKSGVANYVWKPGELLSIKNQQDKLEKVHSGDRILNLIQWFQERRFHGIAIMIWDSHEAIIDGVLTALICLGDYIRRLEGCDFKNKMLHGVISLMMVLIRRGMSSIDKRGQPLISNQDALILEDYPSLDWDHTNVEDSMVYKCLLELRDGLPIRKICMGGDMIKMLHELGIHLLKRNYKELQVTHERLLVSQVFQAGKNCKKFDHITKNSATLEDNEGSDLHGELNVRMSIGSRMKRGRSLLIWKSENDARYFAYGRHSSDQMEELRTSFYQCAQEELIILSNSNGQGLPLLFHHLEDKVELSAVGNGRRTTWITDTEKKKLKELDVDYMVERNIEDSLVEFKRIIRDSKTGEATRGNQNYQIVSLFSGAYQPKRAGWETNIIADAHLEVFKGIFGSGDIVALGTTIVNQHLVKSCLVFCISREDALTGVKAVKVTWDYYDNLTSVLIYEIFHSPRLPELSGEVDFWFWYQICLLMRCAFSENNERMKVLGGLSEAEKDHKLLSVMNSCANIYIVIMELLSQVDEESSKLRKRHFSYSVKVIMESENTQEETSKIGNDVGDTQKKKSKAFLKYVHGNDGSTIVMRTVTIKEGCYEFCARRLLLAAKFSSLRQAYFEVEKARLFLLQTHGLHAEHDILEVLSCVSETKAMELGKLHEFDVTRLICWFEDHDPGWFKTSGFRVAEKELQNVQQSCRMVEQCNSMINDSRFHFLPP